MVAWRADDSVSLMVAKMVDKRAELMADEKAVRLAVLSVGTKEL